MRQWTVVRCYKGSRTTTQSPLAATLASTLLVWQSSIALRLENGQQLNQRVSVSTALGKTTAFSLPTSVCYRFHVANQFCALLSHSLAAHYIVTVVDCCFIVCFHVISSIIIILLNNIKNNYWLSIRDIISFRYLTPRGNSKEN